MKKKILLTFDYELFLGKRSGTVTNCLIIPTQKILDLLDKFEIKAIFFIDTTYIKRLKEAAKKSNSAKSDYENIIKQLTDIAKKGHYLFHHIHPHWLDAIYIENENQWDLSNIEKMSLVSVSDENKKELFVFSNNFLNKIYLTAGVNKKPNGYRAGGLFIEPFLSVRDLFIANEIKYEFSVIKGLLKKGGILSYDFTNCPLPPYYKFSDHITKENINGEFTEYTISSFIISGITKIFNGIYYRLVQKKQKHYGDGTAVSSFISGSNQNKTFKKYYTVQNAVSVEIMNPIIHKIYKKKIKKENYIHFLSHPKLITQQNLKAFNKFLNHINNKYETEGDFVNFE